jgi:O-antigen/teichoic acid export membrane protein
MSTSDILVHGSQFFQMTWRKLTRPGRGRSILLGMFAANVSIQILNFGTGVLTARSLGPAGRGELAAIIMWPQFLAFVVILGLPESLVYYLKKTPADLQQLVGSSLACSLALGAMAALFGIIMLPYWLASYSHQIVQFAQLAMLSAPLGLVSLILVTILQGFESFTVFNWMRILPPAAILIGLAGAVIANVLTPFVAAAIYLIAPLPIAAWNLVYLWPRTKPSLSRFRTHLATLFSYGLRYSMGNFAGMLSSQADRVVIAGFLRPVDLGLYVVAVGVSQLLSIVSSTWATILFPKAAGLEQASAMRLTIQSAIQSGIAAGVVAIPLMWYGPWLLGLVYGAQFRAVGFTLTFLIATSALSGVGFVLLQGFMATGRPGIASLTEVIGVVASISLLWFLTPLYGLPGAALSMLISALLRLAIPIAALVALRKRSA